MAQLVDPHAIAGPPLGPGDLPAAREGVAPRTYRELYSDATNNPPEARTAAYLAGYRFTDPGGAVPTPAALKDQTIALSDRQPMAFLALITGRDDGLEVVIVHRMLRYVDAPGDEPTGLHDHVLGFVGDILPHQYPTVEVQGSAFHLVGTAVRVPTVAAMTTLLPTWEEAQQVLGPYTEQDPETEVIRTRHIQLLPGRYAALLIHRNRVRPKQAYQDIVSAIQAQHETEACQDVIAWLRAACTARGGGGPLNAVPSVLHTFPPLHLPREAYRYVNMKVQADLPALAAPQGPGGGDAAAVLLRTLGMARGDDTLGRGGDGGRAEREVKTIADAYNETYTTLLRYCNVATPESVAPVWTRLANCHKSEQHTVLTQELQKVCMSRGLSSELYAPIITTLLKQMVVGFQFVGHGVDDLSSGCQPFLVAYSGSAHHYLALADASVGNQLAQGEQNASLSDYRTLREKERIKFPRDILEVGITLTRYAVLCQCLFQGVGATHPFVEAMWSMVAGFQNAAPFITERYHALASRHPSVAPTYHARIVRAVQVCTHEYMQMVAHNIADGVIGVEVPNFTVMLQELKRGTFHNSTNWVDIPEAYLDPVPPQRSMTGSNAGGGSGSTTITYASTRTGVSSLSTPPSGETPTVTRTSVTRVENPAGDAEFANIPLRAGGTRNILREHRPPSNDAGQEFCVAWWTKGGCFPNCGRRATHTPFASAGERSRLLAYVRERLQAPAT